RHHPQVGHESEVGSGQQAQLSQGHSVAHRNREPSYRRDVSWIQNVALYQSANWVRSVQHHDCDAVPGSGLHDLDGSEEIGVVSCAGILQIDQHHLDITEHAVGGGGSPAVKAIDWKPG